MCLGHFLRLTGLCLWMKFTWSTLEHSTSMHKRPHTLFRKLKIDRDCWRCWNLRNMQINNVAFPFSSRVQGRNNGCDAYRALRDSDRLREGDHAWSITCFSPYPRNSDSSHVKRVDKTQLEEIGILWLHLQEVKSTASDLLDTCSSPPLFSGMLYVRPERTHRRQRCCFPQRN